MCGGVLVVVIFFPKKWLVGYKRVHFIMAGWYSGATDMTWQKDSKNKSRWSDDKKRKRATEIWSPLCIKKTNQFTRTPAPVAETDDDRQMLQGRNCCWTKKQLQSCWTKKVATKLLDSCVFTIIIIII